MSRVLVTGGDGFVGSHLVDTLIAHGHDVRVLDVLHPAAHAGAPAYRNPAGEHRHGDVRDARTVDEALRGVDHVCHQAAMVGLGTDLGDIADYVAHNDLGTAVLLRALALRGFAGRLVLASSMVVYGEGRYACAEHGVVRPAARRRADLDALRFEPPCPSCGAPLAPQPIPEDSATDPRNVYAATKLHQEHLAQAFARETGVAVTALRYHNVYGPRMPRDTPYAGVASIFASALAAGRAPEVYEDGGQLRDFVHVRDVARANLLALTRDDPVPGAFNVCSGTPRSVGEMARALHAVHAAAAPAPRVTGAYRLGDVRHVFADPARARRQLGFAAREDFAAGMAEFARAELREPATARPT
ncbi:MAG: dTDP-L-rhamnose 4-epimerase [Solirubrobacteraceae bacterium]|nr:dTDP-L-rhamnose 4-epimerase [Solirubrobacteraceae bacterium]